MKAKGCRLKIDIIMRALFIISHLLSMNLPLTSHFGRHEIYSHVISLIKFLLFSSRSHFFFIFQICKITIPIAFHHENNPFFYFLILLLCHAFWLAFSAFKERIRDEKIWNEIEHSEDSRKFFFFPSIHFHSHKHIQSCRNGKIRENFFSISVSCFNPVHQIVRTNESFVCFFFMRYENRGKKIERESERLNSINNIICENFIDYKKSIFFLTSICCLCGIRSEYHANVVVSSYSI